MAFASPLLNMKGVTSSVVPELTGSGKLSDLHTLIPYTAGGQRGPFGRGHVVWGSGAWALALERHGMSPGSAITSCVTWENDLTLLCLNVFVGKMEMKMTIPCRAVVRIK